MCHGQGCRVLLGMVIPPFNRNPYNRYINPYYWVDDHPLLDGNNGSLDPGTYKTLRSLDRRPITPRCLGLGLCLGFELLQIMICTSSTAQGGGGSFKKRKTIGEIGCCESRMSKQKH